ncbi:MAG: phosphatase PAP2 family protein [Lachnospiraceae bacterium]|nr:phosphatase PAP2 family protein [Lachnospiraceae bacterium]
MLETLLQLDGNILLWIQENLRNPVLTALMVRITALGNAGLIWIVITALLLLRKDTRSAGVMSAMALIGSLVINNFFLKNLAARTRPYEVIEGLSLLIAPATDFSFPSGHTGSSLASAWVLLHELPRPWGILAMALAILIAFSRLYVGIHYPSDVLAGALTGILAGMLARKLYAVGRGKFSGRNRL